MKTLDLNTYGVEEMDQQEGLCTEGGFWGALLGAIAFQVAMELIEGSLGSGFDRGRQEAGAYFGI